MKFFFTLLFTSAIVSSVMAADIYVREFGGGGAYPTISEAISAASAGDRILVVPKNGDAPYIENLTINKDLQLLSAINGARFKLQGGITIGVNLPAGARVVIDGLWSNLGNITAANSTNNINVYILNVRLGAGRISLGQNINATIANSTVITAVNNDYAVTIHKGKFLGNRVESGRQGLRISADVATSATDTVQIIGNEIRLGAHAPSAEQPIHAILWDSNRYFYNISNNYVISNALSFGSSGDAILINVTSARSGSNSSQFNNVINNTVLYSDAATTGSVTRVGIRVLAPGPNTARNNIFNNAVMMGAGPAGATGFAFVGTPQISYNRVGGTATFGSGGSPDGTNSASASTVYVINTNGCVTSHVDNGHPDPIFTDLDLTRNDVGACGGSYNIKENFSSQGAVGSSAMVHWLELPKRIIQGGTVSIKAEGHDR